MIDQKHLIGQVAAKNGIRLEPDDPAFALVTLNDTCTLGCVYSYDTCNRELAREKRSSAYTAPAIPVARPLPSSLSGTERCKGISYDCLSWWSCSRPQRAGALNMSPPATIQCTYSGFMRLKHGLAPAEAARSVLDECRPIVGQPRRTALTVARMLQGL
jgi:hypothetical protein